MLHELPHLSRRQISNTYSSIHYGTPTTLSYLEGREPEEVVLA